MRCSKYSSVSCSSTAVVVVVVDLDAVELSSLLKEFSLQHFLTQEPVSLNTLSNEPCDSVVQYLIRDQLHRTL